MKRWLILLYCSLSICVTAQKPSSPSTSASPPPSAAYDADKADEFISNIYKRTYQGSSEQITDFETTFYNNVPNPHPYIYALWFNEAILGGYGKKDNPHQLNLIERILKDPNAHGTLKTASHYQKGMHLMFSADLNGSKEELKNIESIRDWQYVGPFENISHSGFYKDFGPLAHPEAKAEFISSTKAKIKWFTPSNSIRDGWVAICNHINKSTGVVYAQTFVDSPSDQEVYCNAGGGGALKIWINDALIFSDETERVTEFDTYIVKTKLKKGTNRILVQTSFTNNTYPNFSMRLTDKNSNAIPGLTVSTITKPYVKVSQAEAVPVKHFAEEFFLSKIQAEPDNALNYLLLADVYLRNRKLNEAHELAETALQKMPDNIYLRYKFIEVLQKEDNRTRMLEELSKLRQREPNSLLCIEVDIALLISNQQWEDALQKIEQRVSLYGETAHTGTQKLDILAKQKKFDEFLKLADKLYEKYPDHPTLNKIMYAIKKEVNRDNAAALKVYEKFSSKNYNYNLTQDYSKALIANGQVEQGVRILEDLTKGFPYQAFLFVNFADYQFSSKDYAKAEKYMLEALKISPYDESYWSRLGDIRRDMQKPAEAIEAYNKSLLYNPNQYQVINKLRLLKGRSESSKLIPAVDITALMAEKNTVEPLAADAGYVILLNETNIIIHPSGAFEEYETYVTKITHEAGIEQFKESTINYTNAQDLLIELVELIKPSGTHIRAERNDNTIVFPNLEVGDVVVFKYNFKNYVTGRFGDQYWETAYFADYAPIAKKRFTVLAPPDRKINYVWSHSPVKPVIKDLEDFKQYTWEASNIAPIKEEPYMPATIDVAPMLHISTLAKWDEVSGWYADMANQSSTDNYEVKAVLKTLFSDEELKSLNQFQKARRIYEYILTNIRYSSVSFRQGAFVPQPPVITLTTRLGDCKDLSSLFIKLCQLVGIDGRMVLVNTHDNGEKTMLLPSVNFNHCIAKVKLDEKEYYIELTDRYLPFTSLPNNIVNSSILEIARKNEVFAGELKTVYPATKAKDIVRSTIHMKPEGSDLVVNTKTIKYGRPSSDLRSKYTGLSEEKRFQTIEETVASSYKNNVVIEDAGVMENIDNLADSASFRFGYRVKDEIAEIGSIRTFKLYYPDVIAAPSHFPSNTRVYPVNYNGYEDTDLYETKIYVDLPAGKKFLELPANENFTFRGMVYSLTFKETSPGHLEVTRKFNCNRNAFPATEYAAFKTMIEKIAKVEQKVIAFQ